MPNKKERWNDVKHCFFMLTPQRQSDRDRWELGSYPPLSVSLCCWWRAVVVGFKLMHRYGHFIVRIWGSEYSACMLEITVDVVSGTDECLTRLAFANEWAVCNKLGIYNGKVNKQRGNIFKQSAAWGFCTAYDFLHVNGNHHANTPGKVQFYTVTTWETPGNHWCWWPDTLIIARALARVIIKVLGHQHQWFPGVSQVVTM